MTGFRLMLVLICTALLSSCGGEDIEAGTKWPTKLNMAYMPSEEDVERRMRVFDDLAEYLSNEIGIEVNITRTSAYGPMIEALRAGKVDFGQSGGSFTYMIAHEKAGAEAIVARGTTDGLGLYTSIIVTHKSTGIRNLEDLKARQSELVFAFSDPASTSGHMVPRAGLEANNIDPEEFKQTVFTMSHTNSSMTLLSAKVEAGAIMRSSYDRLIETGRMEEGDLIVLWESAPIPNSPIVVRGDLPLELQQKIRQAYLKLNEGGELMDALWQQAGIDNMIYHVVDDSDWDGLRQIAYNIDSMKLLRPPEG